MAILQGQHIRLGGWTDRLEEMGVDGQTDTGLMGVDKEPLGNWGRTDIGVMRMGRQTLGPWAWREGLRVAGSARCLLSVLEWLT